MKDLFICVKTQDSVCLQLNWGLRVFVTDYMSVDYVCFVGYIHFYYLCIKYNFLVFWHFVFVINYNPTIGVGEQICG